MLRAEIYFILYILSHWVSGPQLRGPLHCRVSMGGSYTQQQQRYTHDFFTSVENVFMRPKLAYFSYASYANLTAPLLTRLALSTCCLGYRPYRCACVGVAQRSLSVIQPACIPALWIAQPGLTDMPTRPGQRNASLVLVGLY